MKKITILDSTLRDGMHAMSHKFTPEQMAMLAEQIDSTGVDYIEFGHGNGVGGSSIQYGFGAATDEEYMKAVRPVVKNAKLAMITLPGIGTRYDLKMAVENGISVCRFATQMSECDIARQHIGMARATMVA